MRKAILLIGFLSATTILYSQGSWIQYARTVIGKSSEYGSGNSSWSAQKATGVHNVCPFCGDHGEAWTSRNPDDQREWLVLGYNYPGRVSQVRVYQTWNNGAVDTVYLRNAN